VELFAGAEKKLYAKSDINYLNAEIDHIPENFTLKNLETKNDMLNKNVNSKSNIFAPFNSSIKDSMEEDYLFDISYNNVYMKFIGKVKEANHQYELDFNEDVDGGNLIKKSSSKDLNKLKSGIASPAVEMLNSNLISPQVESNRFSAINTPRSDSITQRGKSVSGIQSKSFIINDSFMKKVEAYGYSKEYITKSLNINELNHATTCYYILSSTKENIQHENFEIIDE